MSRRNRQPNRWGCKPDEDVCVQHDRPLECPHGCKEAAQHKCKFKEQPGYQSTEQARSDRGGAAK